MVSGVDNALPIEPIHVSIVSVNGSVCEVIGLLNLTSSPWYYLNSSLKTLVS